MHEPGRVSISIVGSQTPTLCPWMPPLNWKGSHNWKCVRMYGSPTLTYHDSESSTSPLSLHIVGKATLYELGDDLNHRLSVLLKCKNTFVSTVEPQSLVQNLF